MATSRLAHEIDALLPQTQCTRCGYPSCADYASAIARGDASINRCPPGGQDGIVALARLTGHAVEPLNPLCGDEGPRLLAFIESDACIGCTKCIRACPVDAIIGGPKAMHTVLPALCSGCELCVPPCPVDCIRIVPADAPWTRSDADAARQRFLSRTRRLERERRDDEDRHAAELDRKLETLDAPAPEAHEAPLAATEAATQARRRAVLETALARARARIGARPDAGPPR